MSCMVMNSWLLARSYSQLSSSDPSRQSAWPSQTCSTETHFWPSLQAWDGSEHGAASTHLLRLAKECPLGHLQVSPSGFGKHIWLQPPLSFEQLLLPVDPPPQKKTPIDLMVSEGSSVDSALQIHCQSYRTQMSFPVDSFSVSSFWSTRYQVIGDSSSRVRMALESWEFRQGTSLIKTELSSGPPKTPCEFSFPLTPTSKLGGLRNNALFRWKHEGCGVYYP